MTDTPFDLAIARSQIKAAMDEVDAICEGKRRWTMRVPAQEDRDSDLVIDRALIAAEKLAAEVETLRTQLAEARTENAEFVRELAKEANADGEWQYGYIGVENTFVRLDNDTAREALADPNDRKHILRRWISYGTPQAAEEATE